MCPHIAWIYYSHVHVQSTYPFIYLIHPQNIKPYVYKPSTTSTKAPNQTTHILKSAKTTLSNGASFIRINCIEFFPQL